MLAATTRGPILYSSSLSAAPSRMAATTSGSASVGGVAQIPTVGHIAQQPSHDLAGTGLGQVRHQEHGLGPSRGAEFRAYVPADLLPQILRCRNRADENHVANNCLTGDVVFGAYNGRFGYRRVINQCALNLGGGNAVA